MILAALLYIRRVAGTTTVSRVTPDYVEAGRVAQSCRTSRFPTTSRSSASTARSCSERPTSSPAAIDDIDELPPIVIVRLRNMTAIDATGLRALEDLADRLRASGRTLLLCGAREQPAAVMQAAGFHDRVGARNVCANVESAIARARELHDQALSPTA